MGWKNKRRKSRKNKNGGDGQSGKRNGSQPVTTRGHAAAGAALSGQRDRARVVTRAPASVGVPKLCGADIELGNFVLGPEGSSGTGHVASRALLSKVEGLRASKWSYSYGYNSVHNYGYGYDWSRSDGSQGDTGYSYGSANSQDWGRKYLPANGGCIYIDLDHIELCIPEVLSAWDHVAATHAMLRIVRRAQVLANEELTEGRSIQVLVNNSDGRSNSYGSHLNFLLSRRAWDDLFLRKLHRLLFLASYQVSSIVFTGQGKVGSENRRPETPYQLSQRADFVETLTGVQTTHRRPIVNSRDEALCGSHSSRVSKSSPSDDLARLHCIFFDNTLCHVASLLKVGVMQIILAMIEAGVTNLGLVLDDPVAAAVGFSHGADLQARCRLASGEEVTAVELQLRFLAEAKAFARTGGLEVVPRAEEILALWEDTLQKLHAGDLSALVGRLDWVLKLHVIERSLEQRSDLAWESPELKYLDLLYSSLDPAEGLYWAYQDAGVVERVVSEEEIERFVHEPPEDTRAWTRAMLLRVLPPEQVSDLDWDGVAVRLDPERPSSGVVKVRLDDPLGFTRSECEQLFDGSSSLPQILDGLMAEPKDDGRLLVVVSSDSRHEH